MREFLTALAAILILILAAALVGPLFVPWHEHRAAIEGRLSDIVGQPVRTEGPIDVSLLPAPSVRFAAVTVGEDGTAGSSGPVARIVDLGIEVALLPLLQRQVRITEIRAAEIEASVGIGADGRPLVPLPAAFAGGEAGASWPVAIDRLAIERGNLRLVGADGGNRLVTPIALVADAGSLAGPWRGQGTIGDIALRFSTAPMAADGSTRAVIVAGGERHPRLEFDGTIGPEITGTAKLSIGPPVQPADASAPVPIIMTGALKGSAQNLAVSDIRVDVADGPTALRFEGEGRLSLGEAPRLDLAFHSRFIDADAFLLSPPGQAFLKGSGRGFGAWPLPTRIALKVDTLTLGNEETGSLEADIDVAEFGAALRRFSGVLPGQSRVTFAGADGGSTSHLFGRLMIDSSAPERLAAFLVQLNGPATAARISGGRPFRLTTDLIVTREVVAARALDWRSDKARLTGNLRYTPPETEAGRARLEAQLLSTEFDLATLPDLDGLRRNLTNVDFDITVDARDVRYGQAVENGGGRIQAHLVADADGLAVRTLDIADLAGAGARAAGRISNRGEGTVEGTIEAARIGPLLALAGKIGGAESLIPDKPGTVGEAPLTGRFSVRASNESADRAIVATLDGRSGSMQVKGEAAYARDERGALDGLAAATLSLSAANSLDLLRLAALDVPGIAAVPGEADFTLGRAQGLGLVVSMRAKAASWSAETLSPIPLRGRVETDREGSFRIRVADATPWLRAWQLSIGNGGASRPLAVDVRIRPTRGRWALDPTGTIGDVPVGGSLTINPDSRTVSGTLDIGSASLPALITWAGLVPTAPAQPGTIWSIARFPAAQPMPFNAEVTIRAASVELGDGRRGSNGEATLLMGPESISLRPFRVEHAGVTLSGELSANRQGGRAALAGEITVSDLLALSPTARSIARGRLNARIRFGTAGETPTAMVANLAGAGQVTWDEASLARLAPGALKTVAAAGAVSEGNLPDANQLRTELARAFDRGDFLPADRRAEAPATLNSGVLRIGPFIGETPEARMNLQMLVDLRTLALEGRATLQATTSPPGWIGGAPQVALGWRGQIGQPALAREIDPGPLLNGLAALRLSREVEKIEAMEADDRERAFFNRRLRAERERNQAPPAPPPAPPPTTQSVTPPPNTPTPAPVPAPSWTPPPLPPPLILQPQ